MWGRIPIAPRTSEKKTVEGALIGGASALLAVWVAGLYMDWLGGWESLLLGLVIALAAFLGDLFESVLKRDAGAKDRRAFVIAGDDPGAKAAVTRLLDEFGFDVVDAGPLKEGWRIQRDTPGYGPRRTAEQLRIDLAAAKRYTDQ